MFLRRVLWAMLIVSGVTLAVTGQKNAGENGGDRRDRENFREHERAQGGQHGSFQGMERERLPSGENRTGRPRNVYRMRAVTMPRPARLGSEYRVNDGRQIPAPTHFADGEAIHARPSRVPPVQHTDIIRSEGLARNIARQRPEERMRNRYYWHEYGGRRYSHFYDDHGIDWYGFYYGPSFYWTRYYGGRWWWYDRAYTRWVFWWNGHWWWEAPGGTAFIYMDDDYYPYQDGGITVTKSTEIAPSEPSPEPGKGREWVSPDLKRKVQVTGPADDAFLYDLSGAAPEYMAYLGKNADNVRFTGGAGGQPLQILLDFKDGTFALYDAEGDSIQPPFPEAVPPAPASPPPTAPGSTGTQSGH